MIEGISDGIQLLVLACCFALALVRALRERSTAWVTLACFFACMLLWIGNPYLDISVRDFSLNSTGLM